jgi:gluconate 2-dehydrogenase gamma chain
MSTASTGTGLLSSGRRALLAGTAAWLLVAKVGQATEIAGGLPAWSPNAAQPPRPVTLGGWRFFTPDEASAIEALADRLIPPDPKWPGGKDAGCAVFIDRQLAGPFGESRGLYMRPPFDESAEGFGPQSPLTPAMRYRRSLAALDRYCKATFAGKGFAALPDAQKDKVISGLESGEVTLEGASARGFFELLLQNTQESFFADPLYGGNRDMAGWRMIGFPGARYDYRDWVEHHNQKYPLPPVAISGRPEWTSKHS